jgi:NADH-quinone oxidoreductase subunit G
MAAQARADGASIMAHAHRIADIYGFTNEGWNGLNILHNAAARVGGLDIGFVPGEGGFDIAGIIDASQKGALDMLFLLGVDEIDMSLFGANTFVVYQGHHGDDGAHRADVILPGAAYTEKNATYVNTEGRVQRTLRAVFPPGEAKEDWAILRALSAVLGAPLPYDTLEQLRACMSEIAPHFDDVGMVASSPHSATRQKPAALGAEPFEEVFHNFYRTDPISRASKTMAECTAVVLAEQKKAA